MKKTALALTLILALSILLMIGAQPAQSTSKTITVPDDYLTIQEAINAANEGEIVFVKSGTYQEKQLTINKPLSIVGEDRETTIINLYPQLHKTEPNVIGQYWSYFDDAIVVEADDFTLQGFSINTPEVGDKAGGAITITGNRTCIINNQLFTKNLAIYGSYGNISENRILGSNGLYIMGIYNSIFSNHIAVENIGMHVEGESCVIDGNIVTESSGVNGGIYVSSDRTLIIRNSVNSSSVGIKMGGSENVICANTVTGNELGISIDSRIYNYWKGAKTDSGESNIVYANYLANNRVGAEVNLFPENNVTTILYNNNFINNGEQVAAVPRYRYGNDSFDNGKEGNFWSDYMGTDANGDGIGDTPYVIDANRQDGYPIMSPIDIGSVSIELPEWATAILNPQPTPFSEITPETEPLPISIIATVTLLVVLAVAAGLLVYFKKRKRAAVLPLS